MHPPPAALLTPFAEVIRGALVACFVVALVEAARMLRAKCRSAPARFGPWLLAVTALGFAVRFAWSPRTFLHEYFHIVETLDNLHARGLSPDGDSGPALYRVVNDLLGGEERAMFRTNLACSTLAVPALAALDLSLYGRPRKALLSAALLALLPLDVRFAASETTSVPSVLFSLLAYALTAWHLEARTTASLAAAVASICLGANSRPGMLVLPLFVLALALAVDHRGVAALLRERRSLLGLAGLALGLLPAAHASLSRQQGSAWSGPPSPSYVLSHELFLDAATTPRPLVAMLAAGALWGLVRAPRPTLWALATSQGLVVVYWSFFGSTPFIQRAQLPVMPLLLLVASGAAELVVGLAPRVSVAPHLLAGALAAAGLFARRGFVRELFDQQLEWAFLRDETAALRGRARQLWAVTRVGGRNIDAFPTFLLARHGVAAQTLDLDAALEQGQWPAPAPGTFFYQGMYCYFGFGGEPPPPGMTPRCRELRRRYALRPLRVRTLHARGYSGLAYAPGPYEVGFFEVVGVAAP